MFGTLYIFSAPSGAGKSSLVRALARSARNLQVSVSFTTRAPRPGEREGVDYQFVERARFETMLREEQFLEHAQVFDHYYGTSRQMVEESLRHSDVLLEIDWQGARQVRARRPDAVSIFILPPSIEALKERLVHRGQDSPEVIQRRLDGAKREMCHHDEYDYLVVNAAFDDALTDLQAILQARRLRTETQIEALGPLLHTLLV
jgi:guanylate kinase